jgi:hypothetical protein
MVLFCTTFWIQKKEGSLSYPPKENRIFRRLSMKDQKCCQIILKCWFTGLILALSGVLFLIGLWMAIEQQALIGTPLHSWIIGIWLLIFAITSFSGIWRLEHKCSNID